MYYKDRAFKNHRKKMATSAMATNVLRLRWHRRAAANTAAMRSTWWTGFAKIAHAPRTTPRESFATLGAPPRHIYRLP
jgi:hypothetical protein